MHGALISPALLGCDATTLFKSNCGPDEKTLRQRTLFKTPSVWPEPLNFVSDFMPNFTRPPAFHFCHPRPLATGGNS